MFFECVLLFGVVLESMFFVVYKIVGVVVFVLLVRLLIVLFFIGVFIVDVKWLIFLFFFVLDFGELLLNEKVYLFIEIFFEKL